MSQQPEQSQQQQIQVKISDDVLKGMYANGVQISHTPEEFVLDFMNIFPPAGIINARVLMSPGHIKRFLSALQENLKNYEDQFGPITPANAPEHKIGFKTE